MCTTCLYWSVATVLHCTEEIGVCQILMCCIISDNQYTQRCTPSPPPSISSQENKRKNPIQIRFLLCMFWIFMRRWKTGKLLCGRQPGRSRQLVLSEYFIVKHFPSESWKLFKSEISYFLHKSNTDYQEWSWRWNAMRISKLVICHGLAIWLHTYFIIILLLFYKLHEYVNLFMFMIWFCDMNDLLKVKTIWYEYFSWQRV